MNEQQATFRSSDTLILDEESDSFYSVKFGIRETRRLNGCVMEVADVLEQYDKNARLVLVDPKLSAETIRQTWELSTRVFREDVANRMSIVVLRNHDDGGRFVDGYPNQPSDEESFQIDEIVAQTAKEQGLNKRQAQGNSLYEVLRVLMVRWLNPGLLPITISQLGKETGYTYKPVRQALDELSRHLEQLGHRGVELKSFPREAWSRLILDADSVRETIRFWPEGGMPRTPASMLKRFYQFAKDETSHVGIGGVEGARYYANDLDLIGQPRLDFTVHCPTGDPDLEFLQKLDPSLTPVERKGDACSLVIHLLRRPRTYYDDRFADPVECLLDLQEMRLDAQARQFLRSFPAAESDDF